MSKSFSIECRFNEEPLAADVLERRSWADVTIVADGRNVTRSRDADSGDERTSISIPAFPLAAWLIHNWWAILYEPKRGDTVPPADYALKAAQRDWTARHCLRAAESSLTLPRAFIYSNGPSLDLAWEVDDGLYDRLQPIRIASPGGATVLRSDAEEALRALIAETLLRVRDVADERVERLRANWDAIVNADASESAFCRAAGCMGLDPYASDAWDDSLLGLLESDIVDNLENPLVEDFLESAPPHAAPAIWKWVARAKEGIGPKETPKWRSFSQPRGRSIGQLLGQRPADIGYGRAQSVRVQARLSSADAVIDVAELFEELGEPALHIEEFNHVPDRSIRAIVGWRADGRPVIKGPRSKRPESQRFIEARAIYHAAFGCERGSRLLTSSYTWDQQASRAFAAELLAPREEVANRLGPTADRDDLQQVAAEFKVSERVVFHHAQNMGIAIEID